MDTRWRGSAGSTGTEPDGGRHRLGLTLVVALAVVLVGVADATNRRLDATRADQAALRTKLAALENDVAANRRSAADAAESDRSLDQRIDAIEEAEAGPSAADTAEQAQSSVFTVLARDTLGTGWVVRSDATSSTLATNHHVVEPLGVGDQVEVNRGDLTFPARITEVHADDDLALVVTDHPFPALPVRETEPAAGSTVIIIGSPLGLGGSVSTGVVSAVRTQRGDTLIQFTAPISPGNSGGPVLNEDGRVVGIATEKVVDEAAEGIGFAIPVSVLCSDTTAC